MVKTFTLTCFREKAGSVVGESLVCRYYYVTANITWRGLDFRFDNCCLLLKTNGRRCVEPCVRRPVVFFFFLSTAQVCAFFTARGCRNVISLFLPTCFVLRADRRKHPPRANSSGQESAVHLHLKDKGLSFEDSNVKVAREDGWFKGRGERSHLCKARTTIPKQKRRAKA